MIVKQIHIVQYEFAFYPLYETVDGRYFLPADDFGQLYEIEEDEAKKVINEPGKETVRG